MATIEGNEIALRKVAGELQPPVRAGQEAKLDQDTLGNAFVTFVYTTTITYPSDSIAPSWVYGMTYERNTTFLPKYSDSQSDDSILVAWGGQTTLNEARLFPGQTLEFPRGARKIYIRTDQDVVTGPKPEITWRLDRFARKTWSPSKIELATSRGSPLPATLLPYTGSQTFEVESGAQLFAYIENSSANAITWQMQSKGGLVVLDQGTVGAGVTRLLAYGPGVGNLPAGLGWQGHGIVVPGDCVIFSIITGAPGDNFRFGSSAR